MNSKDWAKEYAKGDIEKQAKQENDEYNARKKRESDAASTNAIFGGMIRRSRNKHFT